MKFIKLNENLFINANALISIFIKMEKDDSSADYDIYAEIKYDSGEKIEKYSSWVGNLESGTFDECIFSFNGQCPYIKEGEEEISCDGCKADKYLVHEMGFLARKARSIIQKRIDEILNSDSNVLDFDFSIHGCFQNTVDTNDKSTYGIYDTKDTENSLYTKEIEFKGYTKFINQKIGREK
ncbi:MAG: hypothetical protein ACLUC0_16430 [Clostridium neonatale]|uniref:hypothetical protein n=1 Tax=Clostridium neonatale TaxID=137838 RepID=UPI00291BD689|nr:hypothetical protein CNEO3_120051 [Clostridium neonatale]